MRFSDGSGTVFLNASLPAGSNSIGRAAIDQTTNIIAGTTMQNAAVAVGNGTNLNVQGYVSALISITGTMSAGSAITFEASVDDVNFVAITAHQIGFAGNLTTITISTGDFRFSCAGYKSIRARISTYGAGTITAKGYVSALSGHPTTINSNIIAALPAGTNTIGNVGASTAIGSAVPANAFHVGANNIENGQLQGLSSIRANFGDAFGAGSQSLLTLNTVYNGSSLDRTRSASAAAATTGIGLLGAGILGFDGTNYQRVAIKLGSTATAAADVSAVVALSPNSPLPTGANTIGAVNIAAAQTLATVTTVTAVTAITNALPAGTNNIGKVSAGSSTTGGLTTFTLISAATTNATSVKATAGTVYSIQASNTGAAVAFLKLFNLAVAPTVGTSVAVKSLIIPAGGGIVLSSNDIGIAFTTGISFSTTALLATADTTAVALSQVAVNIDYV